MKDGARQIDWQRRCQTRSEPFERHGPCLSLSFPRALAQLCVRRTAPIAHCTKGHAHSYCLLYLYVYAFSYGTVTSVRVPQQIGQAS